VLNIYSSLLWLILTRASRGDWSRYVVSGERKGNNVIASLTRRKKEEEVGKTGREEPTVDDWVRVIPSKHYYNSNPNCLAIWVGVLLTLL
jgi:hypothetical protein